MGSQSGQSQRQDRSEENERENRNQIPSVADKEKQSDQEDEGVKKIMTPTADKKNSLPNQESSKSSSAV